MQFQQEFTARPWNIRRCFLPLWPTARRGKDGQAKRSRETRHAGLEVYRGRLRTRRVPSERLRLVSKSHLTLTWGGVMKQHDLRFAEPCSCLIESSVAHPPTSECVYPRLAASPRTLPSQILLIDIHYSLASSVYGGPIRGSALNESKPQLSVTDYELTRSAYHADR